MKNRNQGVYLNTLILPQTVLATDIAGASDATVEAGNADSRANHFDTGDLAPASNSGAESGAPGSAAAEAGALATAPESSGDMRQAQADFSRTDHGQADFGGSAPAQSPEVMIGSGSTVQQTAAPSAAAANADRAMPAASPATEPRQQAAATTAANDADFAAVAGKLGGDLARLALGTAPSAGPGGDASTNAAAALGLSRAPGAMTVIGGMVAIDASSTDGDIKGLLAELQALGLQNGSTWGNTLSGLMPVAALAEAAGLASLLQARAAMAMSNVGAVTSQGDASMEADVARGLFGVDGTGVTIGVMSDSFDNLGGAAGDVTSGDLPAGGVVVIQDLASGGSDEGRAMAQLIHDTAPGAAIQFRTAFLGQADFANGIQQLIAAGSDIIVDDIFYFAEPYFQDGIIAQSADLAVELGVAYFTAAGNSGDDSYQATFQDSGQTISYTNENAVAIANAQLHDFDPGAGVDTLMSINFAGTTATGGVTNRVRIFLQWDDPFSSVSVANGGAVNDYDVLLTDNAGAIINNITASTSIIGGDGIEDFGVNFSGAAPAQFNISIARASGSTANLLKMMVVDELGFTINEFDTPSPTVVGHSNAELVMSVGAAGYFNTPVFGVDPAVNESFSSLGGTPTIFDTLGNRLATPIIRQGPDITAPDGTDTTFFGSSDPDSTGFPNFFGTSAAAPHAAALAALLLGINPNATPDDLFDAMISTALDMDVPGADQLSGAGLVNAVAAGFGLNLDDVLVGTSASETLNGLVGDDVLAGRAGDDLLIGGSGADVLSGGTGADTATFIDSGSGVQVRLSTGAGLGGDAEGDAYNSIETVIASEFADTVVGSEAINVLEGRGDADTLLGRGGADTLLGGAGDDLLDGGAAGDILDGGADIDTVSYAGSAVGVQARLSTGAGLDGDAQGDSYIAIENVIGSNHADTLVGADGAANTLNGGGGGDTLLGRSGADMLLGGAGDDLLDGGADADVLNGGANIDTVSYASAGGGVQARLTTGAGLNGDAQGDTYFGIENLIGTTFGDVLVGSNGIANVLNGNAGDDTLLGNSGGDTLNGGLGKDMMGGGADNDSFAFSAAGHSAVGALRDQITDFEDFADNDTIDLSGFAGVLSFIGVAAFSAANQVRAVTSGANVLIQINTTGVADAESEIMLLATAIGTVDVTDFIL